MKRVKILPLLVLLCTYSSAQIKRNYNWAFGDSVGLNFNTAIPTVDTNYVLYTKETSSVISDSSGNLLFYAGAPLNGNMPPFFYQINVWNKQGEIMPNGDSLIGEETVTQGTLILPTLYDTSMYYIFTIGKTSSAGPRYLYYSIIDMQLDSGRGDVTVKNIQLTTFNTTEKLTAVKHGNGRDWWLITHDFGTNFVFLITPASISGPTLQPIGTYILNLANPRYAGQMCVSPDGNKLCLVGPEKLIDLFDFDRCVGIVSNWIYIGDTLYSNANPRGAYGCSFSPNSKVLYVSTHDTLFQYDLNATNIVASCITLHVSNCQDSCYIGQHQLAPNGYIYIANARGPSIENFPYSIYNANVSYIENPNTVGLGCGFSYLGQYLNGRVSLLGLPNMANYELGRNIGSVCDTLTSISHLTSEGGNAATLHPNPARDEVTITTAHRMESIRLMTVTGSVAFSKENVNDFKAVVDVKELPQGIYFVSVETEKGKAVNKLVVMKE